MLLSGCRSRIFPRSAVLLIASQKILKEKAHEVKHLESISVFFVSEWIGHLQKSYSFLMFFTLLCVFSVVPARAWYHFTSITASTTCVNKYVSNLFSGTWTNPSAGNINIEGVPAPLSGTYAYTYTWENDNDGANPPATVYFKETGEAVGTGTGGSANDGLGDAVTYPFSDTSYSISQGTHYVGMAGTSTITITIKSSATSSFSNGSVSLSINVTPTSKGGYISTSLGGTCHKGIALVDNNKNPVLDSNGVQQYAKVNDTYDASGAFQANTVMPDIGTFETITYTANAVGAWGPSSSWLLHLKSQDTDSDLRDELSACFFNPTYGPLFPNSGTFDCDYKEDVDAGDYTFPYANWYEDDSDPTLTNTIFASGGTNKEHVKMTLTDSNDGSICSENYDLTFHQPVENAQLLSNYFEHPVCLSDVNPPYCLVGEKYTTDKAPSSISIDNTFGCLLSTGGVLYAAAAENPSLLILALANAAGFVNWTQTEPTSTPYTVCPSESDFFTDAENQANNNRGLEIPGMIRVGSALLNDYHAYYSNPDGCNTFSAYLTKENLGTLRYSYSYYEIVDTYNVAGDAYNSYGYNGTGTHTVDKIRAYVEIYQWTLSPQ
jgi:hypothetical protein